MNYYLLLALLNGMVIGTSRAVYGQLSSKVGPFKASLWAHIVGFSFLTLVLLVTGERLFDAESTAPLSAYLGGVFGAFFVVVSSYVFPRLGATNAALLVISGQMITAVFLDWQNSGAAPSLLRCLGVFVVLLGIYLSRMFSVSLAKGKK